MTQKKKTNSKKSNLKKGKSAKVVKKNNAKTNEVLEDKPFEIKEFLIITGIVAGVFLVIYLLTIGAHKLGWFDAHYTKKEVEEAVISYDSIELGTMFDRSEIEYYVLLADMEENSMYISELITSYKEKDEALKIYIVDLNEGLNRSAISEESSTNVNDIKDLKVNDKTLIHVRQGKNIGAYVGEDAITEILK